MGTDSIDETTRVTNVGVNTPTGPWAATPAQQQAAQRARTSPTSLDRTVSDQADVAVLSADSRRDPGQSPAAAATADVAAREGEGGTVPLKWNKMSEKQQYNYLKNLVIDQSGGDPGAWKSKDGRVNIIGVRGFSDGQRNKNKPDKYNDTIFVARMKDGKPQVFEFHATVDAGKWSEHDARESGYGYTHDGDYKGIVHLADGFYKDTWIKGTVPGDEQGLRQNRNVRVHADSNFDGTIQKNERLGKDLDHDGLRDGLVTGPGAGIQFHRGSNDSVGHSSAGCQVIHGEEFDKFQRLVGKADQHAYSYLLIDGKNLPDVKRAGEPTPTPKPTPHQTPEATGGTGSGTNTAAPPPPQTGDTGSGTNTAAPPPPQTGSSGQGDLNTELIGLCFKVFQEHSNQGQDGSLSGALLAAKYAASIARGETISPLTRQLVQAALEKI